MNCARDAQIDLRACMVMLIAASGDQRSEEFLQKVAASDKDAEIRSEAVDELKNLAKSSQVK